MKPFSFFPLSSTGGISACSPHFLLLYSSLSHSVDVLTLVSGRRVRNPDLASYIDYVLDLPRTAKVPLHEAICRQWINAIKEQVSLFYRTGRFSFGLTTSVEFTSSGAGALCMVLI